MERYGRNTCSAKTVTQHLGVISYFGFEYVGFGVVISAWRSYDGYRTIIIENQLRRGQHD